MGPCILEGNKTVIIFLHLKKNYFNLCPTDPYGDLTLEPDTKFELANTIVKNCRPKHKMWMKTG